MMVNPSGHEDMPTLQLTYNLDKIPADIAKASIEILIKRITSIISE